MNALIDLITERTVAASPLWLRFVDTFTSRAPTGPIRIGVERRNGGAWVPTSVRYQLKPTGELAFVNLGRVDPRNVGAQFDLRITPSVPRLIAEDANGESSMTATITTWAPDAPPTAAPHEIRCYPAPNYRFGPGVPTLSGRIFDQAQNPVSRAKVTVTETVLGAPRLEEVRSDEHGWFRLPLRWSEGSTQVDVEHQGATGSATINVPADLGSVVSIPLS